MSDWTLKEHTGCPKCGSKDNVAVYQNKEKTDLCYKKCFTPGCNYYIVNNTDDMQNFQVPQQETSTFKVGRFRDIPERGISQSTCQFYGYQVITDADGEAICHIANYYDHNSKVVGQQIRALPKNFYSIGDITDHLFGMHKFPKGSGSFLTVTEGQIDAMTVAQLYECRYPVISIPSGAAGGARALAKHIKYLESFEKVVFCFDSDDAGRAASMECAKLLTPGKAHIAELPRKDANEMLMNGEEDQLRRILWNTKPWSPEGLIHGDEEIELEEFVNILDHGVDINFPKLNLAIAGLRHRHLYTIVAREKAGKSTFTKELVLDLLSKDQNVGLLYLEESGASALASLIAMKENVPFYQLKNGALGNAEQLKATAEAFLKSNKLSLYDHKGRFDPPTLMSQMRYMTVGLGVQFIILDNISISIAGDTSNNERKMIDKFVSDLVSFIQDTGVTVINVVHVVKNRKIVKGAGDDKHNEDEEYLTRADIHGSGAFSKFSNVVIGLQRDTKTEDLSILKILANRDTGFEGICDYLKYDPQTGRLLVTEHQDGLTFENTNDSFDF